VWETKCISNVGYAFFDFVYIDGNHKYNHVKEDILKWLPKVNPNGVIAGHDYNHAYEGVIKAVDEIFSKDNIQLFPDSSWMVKKDKIWQLPAT